MVVPLLNIPIISVVLLLLAGILIGHLIWYRDRSDDEAAISDLREQNRDLHTALHEHKQAYVELQADMEDQRKSAEQLKSVNAELEQSQLSSADDVSELHNELERLKNLKDQAFHDLDQERQQRRAIQEALTQAEETTLRAQNLNDQLQSQLDTLQVTALSSLTQESELAYKTELETLTAREKDLEDELRTVKTLVESAHAERDALLARLDSAEKDAETIEQLRSVESQLRSELNEVKESSASRESELLAQVKSHEDECVALQTQREELEHELESIRHEAVNAAATASSEQQNRELTETLQTVQTELRRREEDLESLRRERDEALQQIDDERSSREHVEARIVGMEQLVAQRDSSMGRLDQVENELAQAHVQVADLQEQLEARSQDIHVLQNSHEEAKLDLKQETDVLRKKLADLTREHEAVSQVLIDERSRLSSMESENHRLAAMAAEADSMAASRNSELQTTLAQRQVELDTVRTELEELASQLSRERHQREHLQNVVHDQKTVVAAFATKEAEWSSQVDALNAEVKLLQVKADAVASLHAEMQDKEQQLGELAQELDGSQTLRDQLAKENENLEKRIDELNRQTSQLTSQVAELKMQREEQVEELDRLQETHQAAMASRIELETAHETLKESVAQMQAELEAAQEMEEVQLELKTRLDRVVEQRDEAMRTHSEQRAELEQMRGNLEALSAERDTVKQTADQQSAAFHDLQQSHLKLQTQAADSGDRLRRVTVERDSQKDALGHAEQRLAQLESRAKANEETIRNLRRERAAVLANSRQPSAFSFASRSVAEHESGGRMRRDEVLGMVYTQPPKRKDDLKRISGIAQVLEKKLNAFGVYTYRQIMDWDSVAVAEFSKLLSFRDRIERDDWIGQARNLHYEVYGRAA